VRKTARSERLKQARFMLDTLGSIAHNSWEYGVFAMTANFVRACVYAIAGAAMLGLAGCSVVSNGYGGWYWQQPRTTDSPLSLNQNDAGNQSHAKSGSAQTVQGRRG
jgi:hypothetical protein